jgi:hypothetical protein
MMPATASSPRVHRNRRFADGACRCGDDRRGQAFEPLSSLRQFSRRPQRSGIDLGSTWWATLQGQRIACQKACRRACQKALFSTPILCSVDHTNLMILHQYYIL